MEAFAASVKRTAVPRGHIAVFWTGQAGFIFKTHENKLWGLDLYLSDSCERLIGFKRLTPSPLSPEALHFDYILVSHAHKDHFDVDAILHLMRENTKFIGARDTKKECDKLGLQENLYFVKEGDTLSFDGITITAVPCDHGTLAPDAVGFLLDFGGKKVYFTGDTALRPDYFKKELVQNADLLLVPINGMYGNMNAKEGTRAAEYLCPRLTVPYHFWCFAEHRGDPLAFQKRMQEKKLPHMLLRIGEGIII